MLGEKLAVEFLQSFGLTGGRLVLFTLLLVGLTIFTDVSWLRCCEIVGEFALEKAPKLLNELKKKKEEERVKVEQEKVEQVKVQERVEERRQALEEDKKKQKTRIPPKISIPEPTEKSEPSKSH